MDKYKGVCITSRQSGRKDPIPARIRTIEKAFRLTTFSEIRPQKGDVGFLQSGPE
jgi:hypothetical protein